MLTPEDSKRVADKLIEAIKRVENKAILLIEEFDQMRGKPRPSQLAAQQLGGEAA